MRVFGSRELVRNTFTNYSVHGVYCTQGKLNTNCLNIAIFVRSIHDEDSGLIDEDKYISP